MSAQSLALYDCARRAKSSVARKHNTEFFPGLDETTYELITRFAPKLRSIILNFCGSFKDPAMEMFTERMTNLTRLELFGSFLVNPYVAVSRTGRTA